MEKFIVKLNILLKAPLAVFQNWLYIKRHKVKLNKEGLEDLEGKKMPPYAIADWLEENIQYVEDGVIDFPQKPILTFTKRRGDCEDVSRLAAVLLSQLGMETKIIDIYFKEGKGMSGHSIAVYQALRTHLWGIIGTEGWTKPRYINPEAAVKRYNWKIICYAVRRQDYSLEKIEEVLV